MTRLTRRRFLTIAASALACPARASGQTVWTGRALGADARIVLSGAEATTARPLFSRIEAELARVESHFSLHADSALVRLNRDGRLFRPAPEIHALFALAGQVHDATGGVFDPTVQPLWHAIATGGDTRAARRLIGWSRLHVTPDEIRLAPGMALTFNGIAQGHAADRIAKLLRSAGYADVLVDIGEVVALGRNKDHDWQAAITTPDGRELTRTPLSNRALATSSPFGTRIGGGSGHILHPHGDAPCWSTVSVSASDAATADALSTAFCLMDRPAMDAALSHFPAARIEAAV